MERIYYGSRFRVLTDTFVRNGNKSGINWGQRIPKSVNGKDILIRENQRLDLALINRCKVQMREAGNTKLGFKILFGSGVIKRNVQGLQSGSKKTTARGKSVQAEAVGPANPIKGLV